MPEDFLASLLHPRETMREIKEMRSGEKAECVGNDGAEEGNPKNKVKRKDAFTREKRRRNHYCLAKKKRAEKEGGELVAVEYRERAGAQVHRNILAHLANTRTEHKNKNGIL
jgi:hypothetical protein